MKKPENWASLKVMSLKEILNEDFKNAFKSGDRQRVDVLRLINAAIKNREIELRKNHSSDELTDEQVIEILNKESKKRKDSIEMFIKGGRADLKEKEEEELEIIASYLPKQLTKEEIEKEVENILNKENVTEFGRAMGLVMQVLKGRADSKLISEIVKRKLGN